MIYITNLTLGLPLQRVKSCSLDLRAGESKLDFFIGSSHICHDGHASVLLLHRTWMEGEGKMTTHVWLGLFFIAFSNLGR